MADWAQSTNYLNCKLHIGEWLVCCGVCVSMCLCVCASARANARPLRRCRSVSLCLTDRKQVSVQPFLFHVPGSPALFVQCFSRTGWQNSGSRGAETEQTPRTAGTPAVTLSIAEIKKADDRLKYNSTFQTNTLRDKQTKNKQQTLGEDTEQTARAASTHAVTV